MTRKGMEKFLKEGKKGLTELKEKTTVLAEKARKEVKKKTSISRLQLEIIPLSRKREEKLKELGKKTYELVKKKGLQESKLKTIITQIKKVETEIAKKRADIKGLKKK